MTPAQIAAALTPADVTLTGAFDALQVAVLTALSQVPEEGWCLNIRGLGIRCMGLPDEAIRAVVHSLRANSLASYHKGLLTEDGTPAGSGYAITDLGRAVLAELDIAEARERGTE